jgi:type III secretion protein C
MVIDQDIKGVLVEFGRNVSLPVDISDQVKGRLRGQLAMPTAREFLDNLCASYGLVWYFDGAVLHVNTKAEIRTELVSIGRLSRGEATDKLSALGISDARFQVRTTEDAGVISVSGPPSFVSLVRQTLDALARQLPPVREGDEITVHVFRGGATSPSTEVTRVSPRSAELSKPPVQNFAAERTPEPLQSSDPPRSSTVANYSSDAADKAIPTPSAPVQPAPAAVITPAPPPPAPAPVPVSVAPAPVAPVVAPLDRDEINALLVRARTFLSTGDVASARVVLRRAAANDDPQAALALGSTYDPSVLKKLGIISVRADPAQAREWYRKAAALGSSDASLQLKQLVQTDR